MADKNWYKETIEALGMYGSRERILNKLNAVYAHSDDEMLREKVGTVMEQIKSSGDQYNAPKELTHGVQDVKGLMEYCQSKAYTTQD